MTTPIEIRYIEVCGTMPLWYQKFTIVHRRMVHKEKFSCVIWHSNGYFIKWFSLYYSKSIPSCNLIWPHITPLITCKHANLRNFSQKKNLVLFYVNTNNIIIGIDDYLSFVNYNWPTITTFYHNQSLHLSAFHLHFWVVIFCSK